MKGPRVTYILGAGRSGSTVLERLLASAPDAVAVGEIATLWREPLAKLTCSCGAPALECGFWGDVRKAADLTEARLAELAALEAHVVRHRNLITCALTRKDWLAQPAAQRFLSMQADLFGAIADKTGAKRIIDSSKAGPRAWALSALIGVSFIHLRRNPADVAASWRRVKHDPSLGGPMRRPSYAEIVREWLATEASARRLAATRPVLRLDYEALVADPAAALQHLGPAAKKVTLINGRSFRPDPGYHSLNGNPDRFQTGPIELKPSVTPALPRLDAAFTRLTGAALNLAAP